MAYTQEENEKYQPPELEPRPQQPIDKIEILFDKVAIALIESEFVDTTSVENNQKFIRDGLIQTGQGAGILALFQKDIKANQEDLNQASPSVFDKVTNGKSTEIQNKTEIVKEPEMFDEPGLEEDFEIPAFLRKQKN